MTTCRTKLNISHGHLALDEPFLSIKGRFNSRHDPCRGQPDADVRPDRLKDRPGAEQDALGFIRDHLVEKPG